MRRTIAAIGIALASIYLAAPAQAAEPAPAWSIRSLAVPTNFTPGNAPESNFYEVAIQNIGLAPMDGSPLKITDTLPAGVGVEGMELPLRSELQVKDESAAFCTTETTGEVTTVECEVPEELIESKPAELAPSEVIRLVIYVDVPPSAAGTLVNEAKVEGGGAATASVSASNPVSTEAVGSGFEEFLARLLRGDGSLETLAGAHPEQFTMSFAVNTKATAEGSKAPFVPAGGDLKDIGVELPPGLVGNPTAVEECTAQEFNTSRSVEISIGKIYTANDCPDGSVVGLAVVQQIEGKGGALPVPLYNLVPPKGMPAQLGFQVATAPFYIDTKIRTGSDYGITATVSNATEAKRVTAFSATIWGNPADPIHDPLRGQCLNTGVPQYPFSVGSCPSGLAEEIPFLRMPTSCSSPLPISMTFNTWSDQGNFTSATSTSPTPEDCGALPFSPSFDLTPDTAVADSPAGIAANLHLPQSQDPEERATADLREAVVTLPKGLVVNPSGANGLDACTPSQVGLTSAVGDPAARFSEAPASCPEAAKIGTVSVNTPLLDHPLPGAVYVAQPDQNPFGTLLALYLTVDDPDSGVVVKLAGKVEADPVSGQLRTTFPESPQVPFEDFELSFFGGPGAALRTPALCSTYTTTAVMTPHSAPEGQPVSDESSFEVSSAPGGGVCASSEAQLPNAPKVEAGTLSVQAGAYTPLLFNLSRADGSQEIGQITLTPPPGLIGKLAGIPYCPDSALAAAAAKSGRSEQGSPSCPAASEIGSVVVGAGAGSTPFHATGKAYLTGPYKGAPVSMAIVTPAVAGPFDLGTVVVRSALNVDSETARITAVTDPLPRILEGIPLDVRTIALKLDRPDFTLNPTNCSPLAFSGQAISVLGQSAPLSFPFQAGGCKALAFKPKLSLQLKGGTKRSDHPALRAVLQMPKGNANIASVSVALPQSEWLDQGSLNTICTRVQFAAEACPKGSVYGKVTATSPLVDYKLTGPVYLRSSSHELPDLVAVVRGPDDQPIEIASAGRIDSVRKGLRTSFEVFPDAPVSKVVLEMRGGKKKGLIENSRDICARSYRAVARFTAQNGRVSNFKPPLKVKCAKKSTRKKRH